MGDPMEVVFLLCFSMLLRLAGCGPSFMSRWMGLLSDGLPPNARGARVGKWFYVRRKAPDSRKGDMFEATGGPRQGETPVCASPSSQAREKVASLRVVTPQEECNKVPKSEPESKTNTRLQFLFPSSNLHCFSKRFRRPK